jgi:photosystem II stability/assembly factor-like uncharacterized protein
MLFNKKVILILSSLFLFVFSFQSFSKNGAKDTTDLFSALKFRNIGPAVAGGRVSAVVGIPGNPDIYYIGGASGGVFKTTNGGYSWKAVFTKYPPSIGAIALAPSNPNLVWVGTGEANIRNDITDGKGVYYSPDAGATWKFMGLKDAGQISKIIINPTNPKVVFVAAIGHAWALNKERGLYKTTDGGKNWKKVLYVNDTTGVNDVVFEPGNPEVMLAATWQVIRYPWALVDGGKGSGIWESKDGGDTWVKLKKGLPKGLMGRISFGTSLSNPEHVYALIESKHGMLWDSHDFGGHWNLITNNHELDVRPFYFTKMEVAPDNDDKIYFLSFLLTLSKDGGKTVKSINHGVHVDHHAIWIDPKNPKRIVEGNDGGVYQSLTGGKTWHYFDNIPIEQFYQVATDTLIAYNIGGGLQDNNAWYGPSRNLNGNRIDGSHWFTVAGGDGEYVVPAPSDPNIIYSESQDGYLNRLDLKTGLKRHIRPYFFDVSDKNPAELKYRFNWTTPIAVSYHNADEVYLGANVLFKTTDGGTNWKVISPDLTRNDKTKQIKSGGPINLDMSGAETYGTIMSIGLSKNNSKVIWVGTDDGQVQVTQDGGEHWSNVTKNIPNLPSWGRIYQLDVSPFSPSTCYIAVDLHMLDNDKPYVYKTDNFGKSWTKITKGLPDDEEVHVVREDPNKKGFLFLGNDIGLYYSNDNGENWMKYKSNFPSAPVWDFKFVKQTHDLVVATHGRGIFVLDNISPLEEFTKNVKKKNFALFNIQPVYRFHIWYKSSSSEPGKYTAPNPPNGAVIDYYLKSKIKLSKKEKKNHAVPVLIKITNADGDEIDTLHGTAKKGINRVIWNLHYKNAVLFNEDTVKEKHISYHNGPEVLPGTYSVSVTVNNQTETKKADVKTDPRLDYNLDAAKAQFKAAMRVHKDISTMNIMLNRIDNIRQQIVNIKKSIKIMGKENSTESKFKSIVKNADEIDLLLKSVKDTIFATGPQHGVGEDEIHFLTKLHNWFYNINYVITGDYDTAPNKENLNQLHYLESQLGNYIDKFNNIITEKIDLFNKAALKEGIPTLLQGKTISLSY